MNEIKREVCVNNDRSCVEGPIGICILEYNDHDPNQLVLPLGGMLTAPQTNIDPSFVYDLKIINHFYSWLSEKLRNAIEISVCHTSSWLKCAQKCFDQ